MDEQNPTHILNRSIALGERILELADEDAYSAWNDVVLGVLKSVFGQASDQFMAFRFAKQSGTVTGDTPEEKKRGRICATIRGKLDALQEASRQLAADEVHPALGWAQSQDDLTERLDEVEQSVDKTSV